MGKSLYLLILLIINAEAGCLRFINISDNDWLIIQLVYLVFGFIFFGKMESFSFASPKLKYWWWWVVGVLISMLPANYFFNQTISQSLITYRWQFLLLQIPVLFKIAPTKEEIIKATMWFTAFLWVIYFLQLNNPYIINYDTERIERALAKGESLLLLGFLFSSIPLFYYLGEIKDRFSFKSLAIVFVCFLFLFLMQNRSLLFSVTVIIGWSMLTIKHKYKWLIVLVMAFLVAAVAYNTIDVWNSLFEETSAQIDDVEYNRNKAYRYYLFEACPNIWCYIFGNGFISTHTDRYMLDVTAHGVYNSDVGFIGYWNLYGLIPVIVSLLMIVTVIFNKKYSNFMRNWALQILICGLTISYWGDMYLLYFSLFYYLYYYELEESEKNAQLFACE